MQDVSQAAWMQHHFTQTMDSTHHRHALAQSLLIPGAGMLENTPLPLKMSVTEAPDLPADPNTVASRVFFVVISQIASNWEDIANTIRALISSVREWF